METINGYSINDKSRLQAEIESFRRKRNTCLGVGITMSVISIIAVIIVVAVLFNQTFEYAQQAASSGRGSVSETEVYAQFGGIIALIYLFFITEGIGNVVALAGGIPNHVKMANRRKTLQRLKNIE